MSVRSQRQYSQNDGPIPVAPGRGRSADRFSQWFPVASALIGHPIKSFFVLFAIAGVIAPFSIHEAMAVVAAWIFLLAFWIERPLLSRLVIPPLVVLIFLPTLGITIGIPMFLASQDIEFSRPHLIMQLVFILGSLLLFLGYRLGRGAVRPDWWPADSRNIIDPAERVLGTMAAFLCAFDIIRMIIGWRSGSLDRGYAGEVVLEQSIGIWTFAGLFNRWSSLWVILLPFMWARGGSGARLLLVIAMAFYGVVAFASGSRGLVLYPAIYLFIGIYFFSDKISFRFERIAPFLLVGALTYIYVIDVFRNTEAFRESQLADLRSRLSAARSISSAASDRSDFGVTTGRALIGVSDDVIYDMTPGEIPFAGGGDIFPAMLWTWVPQKIKPDKPLLVDGDEVSIIYTNIRNERSSASVSLSADLFRRFGWLGVALGLPLVGFLYGLLVRWVIFSFRAFNAVVGISLLLLIIGGLQNPHTVTVLQTWWIWAYDMPKHLLVMAIMLFFLVGRGSRQFLAPRRR